MTSTRKTLTRAADLVAAGLVSYERLGPIAEVVERYALSLTADVVGLIDRADQRDPIGRQFIPDPAELNISPEERADPIGDGAHTPIEGIVHRYPDRVLLKPLHVCAVYCRFCFRREVVGRAGALSRTQLRAALDYVRSHQEIWEVILSGGDPLVLSTRRLETIFQAFAAIEHVKIIRVHTRVPVVAPGRVTPSLVRAIRAAGKATYVVLHVNHARELSSKARAACAHLVDAGIPMLSQTVLLRGVNDDAHTLGALMRALGRMPRKALLPPPWRSGSGNRAWRTEIAHGQDLARALHGRLSGLCQPTYVLAVTFPAVTEVAHRTELYNPRPCGRRLPLRGRGTSKAAGMRIRQTLALRIDCIRSPHERQ